MPGPTSDSYDPEWSTGHNAERIREELQNTYDAVSAQLDFVRPIYVLELVDREQGPSLTRCLSEKQWRLIRFALLRAKGSI